jgi:hypothetical protein
MVLQRRSGRVERRRWRRAAEGARERSSPAGKIERGPVAAWRGGESERGGGAARGLASIDLKQEGAAQASCGATSFSLVPRR